VQSEYLARVVRSIFAGEFLEILLSVRKQLIITYIGQSISENEDIPASVVIHELLDIMHSHYQLTDLVIKHPLQSFSSRYFSNTPDLISYNQTDLATAKALKQYKPTNEPWWQKELAHEEQEVLEISDLFAYFRHPQKYFLQHGLNIRFAQIKGEEPEREPFDLEDSYRINHQWIVLNGQSPYLNQWLKDRVQYLLLWREFSPQTDLLLIIRQGEISLRHFLRKPLLVTQNNKRI
jgi:exonuclease V gamma subunit